MDVLDEILLHLLSIGHGIRKYPWDVWSAPIDYSMSELDNWFPRVRFR